MSTDRETRIVRSWLQTDEHESAERLLGTVLDRLDTTPQRRPLWRAWRTNSDERHPKVRRRGSRRLVLAISGLALYFSRPATTPGVTQSPTPTTGPTAPATASPTVTPLEGMIIFGRRGGDFGEGRVFALNVGKDRRPIPPTNAAGEELFFDEEACCLVTIPGVTAVVYGTVRDGRIIPTYVDGGYREELAWSEMIEPRLQRQPTQARPRAATTGPDRTTDDIYALEGWDPEDGTHAGVYLAVANGGRPVAGNFVPRPHRPSASGMSLSRSRRMAAACSSRVSRAHPKKLSPEPATFMSPTSKAAGTASRQPDRRPCAVQ